MSFSTCSIRAYRSTSSCSRSGQGQMIFLSFSVSFLLGWQSFTGQYVQCEGLWQQPASCVCLFSPLRCRAIWRSASSTAFCSRTVIPIRLRATVGQNGMSSRRLNSSISSKLRLSSNSSNMLSAPTIGRLRSFNCIVSRRLRSRLLTSSTLMTASISPLSSSWAT